MLKPGTLTPHGWRQFFASLVLLCGLLTALPCAHAAVDPAQGPGGPILVLTSGNANFGTYYAEILRNEGFNHFTVADVGSLSASLLAGYDLVVLAKTTLSTAQVSLLSDWVGAGGNLVAMAPDAKLAGLMGLTPVAGQVSNGYMKVQRSTAVGNGIVDQTMQFHGSADLYSLSGANSLATLFTTASASTPYPAVTLRAAGSGSAAAFTYDLATSIVYMRQGNPAWAAEERDGITPIRSNDKFYGNKLGDPQADWIDLAKVAIPQADEQQRLLANLLLTMNANRKPLPRFWYFPNGKKAVIVMSGDDHGNGGTAGRFDQFKALGPPGCSVANWECVRGTSYLYPATPLSDSQAAQYASEGFEIGLHLTTSCADFDLASLQSLYAQQVPAWLTKYTSIGVLRTQRHHCIAWSDWSSAAQVQLSYGMRLDTSYYYWPPSWANNVPGLFTGSAMPMRYAKLDGSMLDVYQAVTQMTDESGQTYPFTVDTLLDRALGTEGYYGAYTVNAHTDVPTSLESDEVVKSARARGVPVVSAQQMLSWLDARNGSSFGAIGFNAGVLSFTIVKDAAANGLQAMLPQRAGTRVLTGLSRAGSPVGYSTQVVKGFEYAFFAADPGDYVVTYATDTVAPAVASQSPAPGSTGVAVGAIVSVTFSEAMGASSIDATTFELRDEANAVVGASVVYDAISRSARLTPSPVLAGGARYTATLRGGSTDPRVRDAAGNPLAASVIWSFTTAAAPPPPACPCTAWDITATPTNPAVNDPNAIELGVKFRSDVDGYITGIRFYKGTTNTGSHSGSLWTVGGQRLATATFVNETASGWQEVLFSAPVAVSANVVYIASYFAPSGQYAGDGAYFLSAGVDNGPIHLLSNAEGGGNGVYRYGSSSGFPSSTYNATNYWVDVVFTTSLATDTTAPTIVTVTPAAGASGVPVGTTVSAIFSEPMASASVGSTTFELRDGAGAGVAATVTYDTASRTAVLTPSASLDASASYTATVRGGGTDPRVKDLAGNALAASFSWAFTVAPAGGGCSTPANLIVTENCLTGTPASEWDVVGAGDPSIQGFATDISVNRGGTVSFKVATDATSYRFDIYRLGYYGGLGARKIATVAPSASLPQVQPSCVRETATGLVDCGNWGVSGSWTVPPSMPSGVYLAKLLRPDTGGASHIVFIVRDDAVSSAVLFQTSDTTWQAYNNYGGNSFYTGSPAGRAYKLSYNRPFLTRAVDSGQDWLFNAEYPMLRWLEANGYDVSYTSGVDSDRRGNLIRNHRVFLSVGHDEYWSGTQRANVTAARDAGVNLAFLSGNEVFWKTRWEASIDGSGSPHRTLVSYKETHSNAKIDPSPEWTGTWRDPRFSPPADGGRPENELTGTLFMVNDGATTSIVVPAADGKLRLWRNTSVATLATSASATLPNGTLGYEWDIDADNGSRPPGLFRLSSTTVTNAPLLQDQGSTYGSGTAVHSLTMYRHASGARVFGAGTVQWAWGLDATHDRAGTPEDPRMQQATVNLLADMNAQPGSLRSGLVAATESTDVTAPTSILTAPPGGSSTAVGNAIVISGTATDSGGVVGGVEVSVDGGTSWRPASGRASWTFSWTPSAAGTYTLRSRAVDDSGNLETPAVGVTVSVSGATQTCPCTLFPSSSTPAVLSDPDSGSVNLGVNFRSDQSGVVTGIRFYKGINNTGTHVGSLWTSTGTLLASATFTGESASGWQQANFASPVPITANTVYVASYLAPQGRYSTNAGFFSASTDNPPLHAPAGSNGVYAYAAATAFPTSTYQASNYWVDLVFSPGSAPADTTPPTVAARTPALGATGVAGTTTITATFSEAMDPATLTAGTFVLRDSAGVTVDSTHAYDSAARVATLRPITVLAASTTYTATLKGGSADPRVKDLAGNALGADSVWSFTTAAPDTTPPIITATSPASGATRVARGNNVIATFNEAMDPATITSTTLLLRNAANVLVPAAVSYDAATRRAILNPTSTLAANTNYTATVKGGATDPRVRDAAGNPMGADRTWTFTTR